MRVLTASSLLLVVLACQQEPAPAGHAPPLSEVPATVERVERSAWLKAHQRSPAAPQGEPPEEWSELEARIDPAACGTCHPAQYADWKESWHALGMGPGVIGQYLDWDGTNDKLVTKCNRCHAPLNEQQLRVKVGEEWVDNPHYVPERRGEGLTCAGCHVRSHVRHGPPSEREGLEADDSGRVGVGPHGGFVVHDEFQSSSFCESCHDFLSKSPEEALEGKRLQETTAEWRRTPQAAEGQTCQTCHMPDGRHTFKGVHDPDFVRAGVAVEAAVDAPGSWLAPVEAHLTVTNTGAAHRMPTYTTPEIKVFIEQVDESGEVIDGSRHVGSIARRVTPNLKKELWDTRLLPGESYTLTYGQRRRLGAAALVARVEVWPDEAYRRFYEIKLRKPENHEKGAELLREALQSSIDSRYTLWEERLPLPD